MSKKPPAGNPRSAEPMKGVSRRAQELLKPRFFGEYSKAKPKEKQRADTN